MVREDREGASVSVTVLDLLIEPPIMPEFDKSLALPVDLKGRDRRKKRKREIRDVRKRRRMRDGHNNHT